MPPTLCPVVSSPLGSSGRSRTPLSVTLPRRYFGSATHLSPGVPSPSPARNRRFVWNSVPLASVCPASESPHIPAVVIHCVNEVAARGLGQIGIYRVPGAERKVNGE